MTNGNACDKYHSPPRGLRACDSETGRRVGGDMSTSRRARAKRQRRRSRGSEKHVFFCSVCGDWTDHHAYSCPQFSR